MEPQGTQTKALVVRDLTKSYAGVTVLHSVNLSVPSGKVVGLIGENGAGKSTTSSIIAGIVQPDAGTMTIDGIAYEPSNPAAALDQGVALIHQEIRMVPALSVAENMFLGRLPLKGARIDRAAINERSADALRKLGVNIDPRRPVAGLSIAMQQSIEIAKAITRDPRYVIFDEPSAALTESETDRVLRQINVLREHGAGIIYISHRLQEIRDISDEIVCMRDGRVVKTWDTGNVETQSLVQAMVGRDVVFEHKTPPPSGHEIAIEVRDLARNNVFEGVNFSVTKGEIFGIAGLVGAGRTEVVRAIAGADRADQGEVHVEGKQIKVRKPADSLRAGIVMVPEDRKQQGLNLTLDSARNITSPWERVLRKSSLVTQSWVKDIAEVSREAFDIRGDINSPVMRLSGGNQQKVLLAKWLVRQPKVLILDEPTRGVDVGAKLSIYEIIRETAARGVAVIVVSSELEEVLGLAHRVLVMSGGRQMAILNRDEATSEAVMSLAVPQTAA